MTTYKIETPSMTIEFSESEINQMILLFKAWKEVATFTETRVACDVILKRLESRNFGEPTDKPKAH